jgi:hypothetical protein
VLAYHGLVCISLMFNDVKYFFMELLAVWMSSLGNCLYPSPLPLKNGLLT